MKAVVQCPVRLIVAGSDTFTDEALFTRILNETLAQWPKQHVEIICGMDATLINAMVVNYWETHQYAHKEYPANTNAYGEFAVTIRNEDMVKYATHVLVLWDGQSSGTANLLDHAKKCGLTRYQFVFDRNQTDGEAYIPCITATQITNNRLVDGRAIFQENARYLCRVLKQPVFPKDRTTFPLEWLKPAFQQIRKELDEGTCVLGDARLLQEFMSYIEQHQLYVTVRRCPINMLVIPTAQQRARV